MKTARDVVVTGLGVVSPIGIGRDAFWQSLQAGTSGVRLISGCDARHLRVRIGGELHDFEPKLYVKPRKSLKVMSHEMQMGVASATLAMEDADLNVDDVDPARFGVVYGSEMLYGDVQELQALYSACTEKGEFQFDRFGDQFPNQIFPLWMLKYLPNMTASHIGIAHGARGPNNSIVLSEVSSLLAIIEATTTISRDAADIMLAGGAGSRLAITPRMYRGDVNLSQRNSNPTAASRPFDADRDGMVNGEGAGSLVLESRAHATARGATIIGTIAGFASTHCGRDTGVMGQQAAVERSLCQALANATLATGDVGHVDAHGLSTREQDMVEAQAIRRVCGDVPVTAMKSYFGNLGAGGGTVELAASLLGIEAGSILPTLNYENPAADCPVHVVVDHVVAGTNHSFVKLNQSTTGQAVAVVIR